jgi:hypothetical protein
MMTGMIPTIILWIRSGILWLGEKTTTNENRYNDSGITHKSGTGVMSVVKKAVTPSIRLEGTNVSPIHRSRRSSVSPSARESTSVGSAVWEEPPPLTGSPARGSDSSSPSATLGLGERHSITAEARTSKIKSP